MEIAKGTSADTQRATEWLHGGCKRFHCVLQYVLGLLSGAYLSVFSSI
jgi:hypothetical protein